MKKTRKSIFIGILSFAFAFCTIGALATSLNDVIITDAATTATVNKMNFEEGASVRTTAENMGIRFKANYDASIYNLVEAGTATAGMIIVPEKALAGASGDYFSYLQTKFNKKPEDVSTQFTIDYFTENKDGTYQASGAIVNLLDENLVYEYQAVAYYYTETNGYVYSGKSDMRTISYVTNAALQSNDLTEQQRADTLQMATTLSQRLETLGKTSNSQFAIETTVAEGIDLTGYESKDKSIVSAVLNGVAVEMVDNKVVLTEAQEVAATQVLKLTYSDDSVLNIKVNIKKVELIPVDVTIYMGIDDQNMLTAAEIFGKDTEYSITSITDENGEEIIYRNGVVTLPDNLTVGSEYTWTVGNGVSEYEINVFVATNVIRTVADIERLFNYTQGDTYYVDGASGYYVLANNIDGSGYTHTHGMTNSSGMGLTGTFDGRGYTIDGITFANAGLFGFVQGGTIKNVGLTNVTVQTTGEAYVLTQQSSGMTVDNVFVEVTYSTDAKAWNQGMFEKAWGNANISNVMVIAKGGNANAFALGAMWNYEAKYSYTNVYAISELLAVRKGESTGITIYSNVETFEENVETSSLTNFNEYWDLTGNYPRLNSMPKLVQLATTIYVGLEDDQNVLTAEQVFGEGTEESIVSITDKNGNEIAYSNGVITLPEGLLAGNEYKWNVSNGKDTYIINVFVATNVIRTIADIQRLFTYSDSHTYYVDGARGYYVLGNNIDATGYTHTHSKVDSTGAGLIGTFDGRGYTIDGITFENAGLFGYVQGGTIKNVGLTNVKMQGTNKTEVYVITKQSNGMTIDNVFVSVEYNAVSWNQGLFEKAWGNASISNMMVVATGGNANTFAVGAMYNYETKYSYTNVYVISELLAVRVGASTGITIYADALAFATNVDVSSLTGFNSYWDLTGAYPILKSALKYTSNNLYEGIHIYAVDETEGMLVEGGNTVYKIVKPNNPTAYESNAVYELHFFSQEQRV